MFRSSNLLLPCTVIAAVSITASIYYYYTSFRFSKKKLASFIIDDILSFTFYRITLVGHFYNSPQHSTIVILEQSKLYKQNITTYLKEICMQQTHHNDIYSNYNAILAKGHGGMKVTVIHPATKQHVLKYSTQETLIIHETPEMYEHLLFPIIQNFPKEKHQWVYNILEHKQETECILYENLDPTNGFILLPDTKWHTPQATDALYCLAICHRRDISSIRDLKKEHLPLLYNIRDEGMNVITSKYDLSKEQIVILVHYLPTYYHFHVHFIHINRFMVSGSNTGDYFLETIINNIENSNSDDYYKKSTLTYLLGDKRHKTLYEDLQKQGYLKTKEQKDQKPIIYS